MTADNTVNSCGKALKITETLQVMERQGYFYEGKISCYRNVLFRMFFPCGKGSKQAGKCGKSIRESTDRDHGCDL